MGKFSLPSEKLRDIAARHCNDRWRVLAHGYSRHCYSIAARRNGCIGQLAGIGIVNKFYRFETFASESRLSVSEVGVLRFAVLSLFPDWL